MSRGDYSLEGAVVGGFMFLAGTLLATFPKSLDYFIVPRDVARYERIERKLTPFRRYGNIDELLTENSVAGRRVRQLLTEQTSLSIDEGFSNRWIHYQDYINNRDKVRKYGLLLVLGGVFLTLGTLAHSENRIMSKSEAPRHGGIID